MQVGDGPNNGIILSHLDPECQHDTENFLSALRDIEKTKPNFCRRCVANALFSFDQTMVEDVAENEIGEKVKDRTLIWCLLLKIDLPLNAKEKERFSELKTREDPVLDNTLF